MIVWRKLVENCIKTGSDGTSCVSDTVEFEKLLSVDL